MKTKDTLLRNKLALALLIACTAGAASAAGTATQDVNYEVQAINELAVSGSPSLTISTAVAGSAPTQATNASSSYAITTNQSSRKITAAINTAMPAGVTLKATLAAPSGATSQGAVTLGTVAVDAVTGISTLNESGKTITYTLDATAAAGVVALSSKTVTYTIAAGI